MTALLGNNGISPTLTTESPILGTAAQLLSFNPTPELYQLVLEIDTGLQKIGNGITAYNSLAYRESPTYYTVATGTDTYVFSNTFPDILAYYPGLRLRVLFTNANTGAATGNLNSFGAKGIKKSVSLDLQARDLIAGGIYDLTYDGTNLQLMICCSSDENIDGGAPDSVYLPIQLIDGGGV